MTLSGPTHKGPPTPPVALSQVLDLNSEEPMYHTLEDELEHQEIEGSPHSHRYGDQDPHAMDLDEESSVGRDWSLTLTEVKASSFGKLEGLTRPFLFEGPYQTIPFSAGFSGLHGAPACVRQVSILSPSRGGTC